VALKLLFLDELIPSGTECEFVDGLKSHHAPRFVSSHISVTMPATVPDEEEFNGVELILVTQLAATQPIHRATYKEVARITDMAKNRKGKLGEKAKEALRRVKSEVLASSTEIVIKWKHVFIPDSYFKSISPRYLRQPAGSRFSMLRFKIGNTKRMPFTCLELRNKSGTCLPYMTIDSKEGGHLKCSQHFSDYAGLCRHLATMHFVYWLCYHCPWCGSVGFEKAKISRHVAICTEMPPAIVELIKSVERGDEENVIREFSIAAESDLVKVEENDAKYKLERKMSLSMSRAEALFRQFAEKSDVKHGKVRWKKSRKPDDEPVVYEENSSVYCFQARKYPNYVQCPGVCKRTFMDTEMASKEHLLICDLQGFTTFHAQKALGEALVDDVDRSIFNWHKEMEKKVDKAKEFLPEIALSVDGFGGSRPRKKCGKEMKTIMKEEALPLEKNPAIHAKRFVKKERNNVVGGMTVLLTFGQDEVKAELTEQVVSMPSFNKMAEKRKIDLAEFTDENLKRKCARKSLRKELFGDAWKEYRQSVPSSSNEV